MLLARLHDAAIALDGVLTKADISYGIFGGYAIAALGGERESRDIDCEAVIDEQGIIAVLDGHQGFQYVDTSRWGFVNFLWSEGTNGNREDDDKVLVEIFVASKLGSLLHMEGVTTSRVSISGQANGAGAIAIFNPEFLFNGKLKAAAHRSKPKFHDVVDLLWLQRKFGALLKQMNNVFAVEDIALAMQRYHELEFAFARIGFNVEMVKATFASTNPNHNAEIPKPSNNVAHR